ncbi:MAG: prepilin-type N-terminal cleavage/methylation domain-containing protein [Proteobacteria bacterium]|nr:prepilin-type N-terminal cleavage/methylation domain-containing protein [Pseudomonadota bacterium]MBU1711063.1 prepilin-type N-terminal cleavage/methylation domain-containing protein [Pseudomonadota bacterium]
MKSTRKTPESANRTHAFPRPELKLRFSGPGFTLIEIIMTIVILGSVSLILIPFFKSIAHSPDPLVRQKAVSLGQALMDEILSKKWDQLTPVGGGPLDTDESTRVPANGSSTPFAALGTDGEASRANWNDVDDYNGLDETSGNLRDQNDNLISISGYTRKVWVGYIASNTDPIAPSTAFLGAGVTSDTKLIKVKVESPLGEDFTYVAVSCNL